MTRLVRTTAEPYRVFDLDDESDLDEFMDGFYYMEEGDEVTVTVCKVEESE